jgi:hypothetical protein
MVFKIISAADGFAVGKGPGLWSTEGLVADIGDTRGAIDGDRRDLAVGPEYSAMTIRNRRRRA